MESKCYLCDSRLVSIAEIRAGGCLECYPRIVNEHAEREKEIERLNNKVIQLEEHRTLSIDANKKRILYASAQEDGRKSMVRGADKNQNPFKEGSKENIFWEQGWLSEYFQTELKKMLALIDWSIDNFKMISDIALGEGHKEIHDKIDIIVKKMEEQITVEVLEQDIT